MKKMFLGILIGACLPLIAGFIFIISGGMPVATKDQPLPLEHWIAKKAIRSAYQKDLGKQAPFQLVGDHANNAAKIYRNNCSGCHGINDHENLMAKAMFPPPPQFFQTGKDLKEDPMGEIYWKVKNGIRLTGMPGYSDILSETEIWEVTLFLKNGEPLPVEVK